MTSIIISIILIALTPIPWWGAGMAGAAYREDRSVDELLQEFQRFAMAGVAGICMAILSASYLLALRHLWRLPSEWGVILLLVAILSIYAQPAWFIYRHKEFAMRFLGRLFQTEPVLTIGTITGALDALILLGVAFGASVTPDQKTAIDAAVSAVLGVAAMVAIRGQVAPATSALAALPEPK